MNNISRRLDRLEKGIAAQQKSAEEKRATMALFDDGHRISLPGGYWLEKSSDNHWQIGGIFAGRTDVYLAMNISGNVPVGHGGSMDRDIKAFADGLNAALDTKGE